MTHSPRPASRGARLIPDRPTFARAFLDLRSQNTRAASAPQHAGGSFGWEDKRLSPPIGSAGEHHTTGAGKLDAVAHHTDGPGRLLAIGVLPARVAWTVAAAASAARLPAAVPWSAGGARPSSACRTGRRRPAVTHRDGGRACTLVRADSATIGVVYAPGGDTFVAVARPAASGVQAGALCIFRAPRKRRVGISRPRHALARDLDRPRCACITDVLRGRIADGRVPGGGGPLADFGSCRHAFGARAHVGPWRLGQDRYGIFRRRARRKGHRDAKAEKVSHSSELTAGPSCRSSGQFTMRPHVRPGLRSARPSLAGSTHSDHSPLAVFRPSP